MEIFCCRAELLVFFINFFYENFHHLVHSNLQWFYKNNFFFESADAIEEKMGVGAGLEIPGFVDCNCMPGSRVGGGPTEKGANSARWSPLIQQAFYNGEVYVYIVYTFLKKNYICLSIIIDSLFAIII